MNGAGAAPPVGLPINISRGRETAKCGTGSGDANRTHGPWGSARRLQQADATSHGTQRCDRPRRSKRDPTRQPFQASNRRTLCLLKDIAVGRSLRRMTSKQSLGNKTTRQTSAKTAGTRSGLRWLLCRTTPKRSRGNLDRIRLNYADDRMEKVGAFAGNAEETT